MELKKSRDGKSRSRKQATALWHHLVPAMQHAMHPRMVDIMKFARIDAVQRNNEATAAEDEMVAEIENWKAWKEELVADNNCRFSRITAIIDIFKERRDGDLEFAVLIFDDSVYFWDIGQIAFANMPEPVQCMRYDGREPLEKRTSILDNFKDPSGPNVLLISRAAGDVGLNVTCANVVILCGPWWNREWEHQAEDAHEETDRKARLRYLNWLSTTTMRNWTGLGNEIVETYIIRKS
jgi:hypothetical protein